MIAPNPQVAHTVLLIIEFIGTFAFAISGIRMAAAKHFDWFGGFVCGFAVAIGGGTIRDVMLRVTPFWMTSSIYFTCTIIALLVGILFSKKLSRMENAWLITDTLGLAMFTIAGLQKTLLVVGCPWYKYWYNLNSNVFCDLSRQIRGCKISHLSAFA